MSKYVIKNCPVCEFSDWEECTGYLAEGYICNDIHTEIVECKDRTDCVMKQIYETCIEYHKNCKIEGNCIDDRTCTSCFFGGGNELADDILQLLQIEEVE